MLASKDKMVNGMVKRYAFRHRKIRKQDRECIGTIGANSLSYGTGLDGGIRLWHP